MTRFDRIVRKVKRFWWYRADGNGDKWTWGHKVLRRWAGDCEDYCFRVVWKMEGSKSAAIEAIRRGDYVIWFVTTGGDEGKPNHAAVWCKKTDEYAEVIFGRAVKDPDTQLGTIRLIRPFPPNYVLLKLGVVEQRETEAGR